MMQQSKYVSLLVLIPGTLWGLSFVLVDIILREMPTLTLTAVRSTISAVALVAILYLAGGRLPNTWPAWWQYILLGFFNNALPFTMLTFGQTLIDSGRATILTSAMPLFTILLAHFLTEEKLNAYKIWGILIGFSGVLVFVGPSALYGIGGSIWGQLSIIGAALSYAVGNIMIRSFFEKAAVTPPASGNTGFQFLMEVSATQFMVTAALLIPFSLMLDEPWALVVSGQTWAAMMALAIAITVVAGVIYFYLIDTAGAGAAAASVYLIPISGVLGSAIFLGQAITLQIVAALGFILLGITLVNRKPKPAVSAAGR